MADFREAHCVNADLPFNVGHYESRLKASSFDDSLELLAALATIISVEGPMLEPPKMGYFSTFRVSMPKYTRRKSPKNSPKHKSDKYNKQSKTMPRVSTLKRGQAFACSRMKSLPRSKKKAVNVKGLYNLGQGRSREQQYKSYLLRRGVYQLQSSHYKYKCVVCPGILQIRTAGVVPRRNASPTQAFRMRKLS